MKSQIITLLLVLLAFVSTDGKQLPGDTYKNHDYIASDLPQICPAAEDIAPCVCIHDIRSNDMDLDCSAVESEEQLKQIFKADFPSKEFSQFTIIDNNNLRVLESSVFNGISFESLEINNGLEVIEMHALDSCYETAYFLDFSHNEITSFPFDDLSQFSKLKNLEISENHLKTIPADAFNGLTSLEILSIDHGNPAWPYKPHFIGTFENLPNLKEIYLYGNRLTDIPTKFINTGSSNLKKINLFLNHIASVEPGAFDIVEGLEINMEYNSLSTLEEKTWQPLLKAGVILAANDNPLSCGCDIAWLFDEDNLLRQVDESTTCSDGKNIHDLDPSIFDNC